VPFASAANLPLARVGSAAPQQGLYFIRRPSAKSRDAAVEDKDKRQDRDQPGEYESGWGPPLPSPERGLDENANAEHDECHYAGKGTILQLKNGKALACLDCITQNGRGQWVVEVVEGEVEQAKRLLAVISIDEVLRRSARIDASGLVRNERVLPGNFIPGLNVGVQVGEDKADGIEVAGTQVGVDSALNGRGWATAAGTEVDDGVVG
jgi:hypothetical protein